jgi:nitrite reductase/ring-hydroxylating ferredoxin subunit/DMSO/TMAO reductase YedYZ heme-binding membrane subunit
MGHAYRAVGWNRQKRIYDTTLAIGIGLCVALFIAITFAANPLVTAETLLIRAFAASAFVLLHVILSIGPLCRLDARFLPLLYNRRHLGVAMFVLALAHGVLAFVQFHALGVISPFESLFTSDGGPGTIPFQPLGAAALAVLFLMAATSHDFWLRNLTPPTWKALHMAVYVAYALIVLHVAFGFLQANTSPYLLIATATGALWLFGLHLVAAQRERAADRVEQAARGAWIDVGEVESIPDGCAKTVSVAGERVAIFRYGEKLSALSSVCRHQNGPLGEGRVVDGCVVCPWHGYQYRPHDGRSPEPFTERVPTFRVRVEGTRVLVDPRPLPAGTAVEPAHVSAIAQRDERELYVGYLPHSPPRQARFTRGVVLALFAACLAVVSLVALTQAPLRAGQFEFGVVREFRGVLASTPHPHLRVQRPGGGVSSYLLVAPGKHGADEFVREFDGRGVTLRGSLVHSGGRTMVVLEPGSIALADVSIDASRPSELGRVTLRGEIVDSKCHLGVMTPGERRTHRACAQLCIRGGIPPLFWVENERGDVQRLLLVGANGEAVNERVLELVGLPLEIEGVVSQLDDWLVLSADPAGYRRIEKGEL